MRLSTKEISLVALFASLTAIGGFISIPIGDVPITLQSLFVILSGLILGPKLGPLSQIIYILLGIIGMPIFAQFTGGIHTVLKPSFGFIIGFVFSSYISGKVSHHNNTFSKGNLWLASTLATITIYVFGLPYMYYILNTVLHKNLTFSFIVKTGFLIFLPGDILKLIISTIIGIKILPILKSTGLSYK